MRQCPKGQIPRHEIVVQWDFQIVTGDSTYSPGFNNIHKNNCEGQLRNSRVNLNTDFLLDVTKELILIKNDDVVTLSM